MKVFTRRGLGNKLVWDGLDDIYHIGTQLVGLEFSNSYYFIFYDSETNIYYEGVKVVTADDGSQKEHYRTRKVVYKASDATHKEYSQDLLNGYNLPNLFTDKSQIYRIGPVLDSETLVILQDSEGGTLWEKIREPGTEKSHWKVYGPNISDSKLEKAEVTFTCNNQINQLTFSVDEPSRNQLLRVTGENFITNNLTGNRIMNHGVFDSELTAITWVYDSDSDKNILPISLTSSTADTKGPFVEAGKSNGNVLVNHLSPDSDYFSLLFDSDVVLVGNKLNYRVETSHSEIEIVNNQYTIIDSEYWPLLSHDTDMVVSSFPYDSDDYDQTEAPWNVFNDSDNYGFKAVNGRQSGYIGAIEPDNNITYRLKQVIMSNTPATLAPNRPYDFTIESYSKATQNWSVVVDVKGFNGYTYNYTLPDPAWGDGFRINVTACQPNFDSEDNGLEIKNLDFIVDKYASNIDPAGCMFFVNNIILSFQQRIFKLTKPTQVYAFLGGAGGSGGGGTAGAGGSGGSYVVINNVTLDPGVYKISSGFGGSGGKAAWDVDDGYSTDGQNGEDTVLENLTTGKIVARADGGRGGKRNSYFENPFIPGSKFFSPDPTPPRSFYINNVDYPDIDAYGVAGQPGGGGADSEAPGYDGYDGGEADSEITVHYYIDEKTIGTTKIKYGSGGGGGTMQGQPGTGGAGAGSPIRSRPDPDPDRSPHGIGGGFRFSPEGVNWGGGSSGVSTVNFANADLTGAGNGSTGMFYIIFK